MMKETTVPSGQAQTIFFCPISYINLQFYYIGQAEGVWVPETRGEGKGVDFL